MFVNVRFGIFLHKCIQSVHTFTVTIAIVIENRVKEWNMCKTVQQQTRRSKRVIIWSINMFVLIFLVYCCSLTFCIVREQINEWIQSNSYQCSCSKGTIKNPCPQIKRCNITKKILISLTNKCEELLSVHTNQHIVDCFLNMLIRPSRCKYACVEQINMKAGTCRFTKLSESSATNVL